MAEQQKIYAVSSGAYSDYCIEALFSSEALANEYIDFRDKSEYPRERRIEAFKLDIPKSSYVICGTYSFELNKFINKSIYEGDKFPFDRWNIGNKNSKYFSFAFYYNDRFEDEKVLVKAIQDSYAEWKAKQEGLV